MGNQIIIINSSEASWDQTLSFGISQLLIQFCLRHVADEYMINVKLRPAPTRVNAILGCPYEMVRNGYYIHIFFLLTSGIVSRTLLGFRKSWCG